MSATTEAQIRDKYGQDLVRLANYIKSGSKRSELLLVCNVGQPIVGSLLRTLIETLFDEINTANADDGG